MPRTSTITKSVSDVIRGIYTSNDKVDKITGKGLSANDYTDEDKDIVDGVTGALAEKVDKDIIEVLDEGVYLFRKTPDGKYTAREEIVGGTVAVNQLVESFNSTYWGSTREIATFSNGVVSISNAASSNEIFYRNSFLLEKDHVYFTRSVYYSDVNWLLKIYSGGMNYNIHTCTSGEFKQIRQTLYKPSQNLNGSLSYSCQSNSSVVTTFEKTQIIDLTLALGSTVADYLHNLGDSAGISKLREWGFPINTYIPYNAGSLQNVKTSGKKVVGKNLIDIGSVTLSASGFIISSFTPIELKAGSYIFSHDFTGASSSVALVFYDRNKTEIARGTSTSVSSGRNNSAVNLPVDCAYYNYYSNAQGTYSNFQLELGSIPTEYEPYTETIHALSPIELRGVPKLVEGNLVYDGDTYESNGKVSRKYGIVDLGNLNWAKTTLDSLYYSDTLIGAKNFEATVVANAVCSNMIVDTMARINNNYAYGLSIGPDSSRIRVNTPTSYTDAAAFKAAMSGVMLVYELDTPIEETADTYANAIAVNPNGTEEWIDDRIVPVPVGHKSKYGDNKFAGDILGMTNVQERVDELVNDTDAILNVYGGSKNILPNNAVTQTINGITFTVNSDGSITVNGKANADTYIRVGQFTGVAGQTYILSGCPTGGGANMYFIYTNVTSSSSFVDSGNGIIFTASGSAQNVRVMVKSGTTANNLIFYPMIRDARIKDATYVPYAMTNMELTNEVLDKVIFKTFATISNSSTITWNSDSNGGLYEIFITFWDTMAKTLGTSVYLFLSIDGNNNLGIKKISDPSSLSTNITYDGTTVTFTMSGAANWRIIGRKID